MRFPLRLPAIAIFLIAALAAPSSAGAAETYTHPQLGWSIAIPENWVLNKKSAGYVDFGTVKGAPWARVGIRVFTVKPGAGPLEKFAESLRASARRQMEKGGVKIRPVSSRNIRISDGIPALEFVDERISLRGNSFVNVELWTLLGDRRFLVNAATLSASWDNLRPVLLALIGSFAPVPPPAAPAAPQISAYGTGAGPGGLAAFEDLMARARRGEAEARNDLGTRYEWGLGVAADYAEALKWYRAAAAKGSVLARYNLGQMAYKGKGRPRNFAAAAKFYRQAAEAGLAEAQNTLGHLYEQGLGVAQNYATARKWFEMAADNGNLPAIHNLGDLHYAGKGVAIDHQAAAKLFAAAARRGLGVSQHRLGYLYSVGHGVLQDPVQAHMWLSLAIARLPKGRARQASVRLRDDLEADMSYDEIAEAEDKARAWKPGK